MCSVPPGQVNVVAPMELMVAIQAAALASVVVDPGALVTVAPAAVPMNQPSTLFMAWFMAQKFPEQLHATHPPTHLILYEPAGNEVTTG